MARSKTWLADRLRVLLPKREELEGNRFLRPVAHLVLRPALWRFTRRSVPRAVAIGLFIGILVMVPMIQPVIAAMVAIPFRGNVPLTIGTTLLTNPVTTPFILAASLWIGSDFFGFPADPSSVMRMIQNHATLAEWEHWLLSTAAPALLTGLFVLAMVSGIVGYFGAKLVWRLWISDKWRRRKSRQDNPY